MSLADCERKCDQLQGCTAVTVVAAGGGLLNCYRKANVVESECDHGTSFDTFVRVTTSESYR